MKKQLTRLEIAAFLLQGLYSNSGLNDGKNTPEYLAQKAIEGADILFSKELNSRPKIDQDGNKN